MKLVDSIYSYIAPTYHEESALLLLTSALLLVFIEAGGVTNGMVLLKKALWNQDSFYILPIIIFFLLISIGLYFRRRSTKIMYPKTDLEYFNLWLEAIVGIIAGLYLLTHWAGVNNIKQWISLLFPLKILTQAFFVLFIPPSDNLANKFSFSHVGTTFLLLELLLGLGLLILGKQVFHYPWQINLSFEVAILGGLVNIIHTHFGDTPSILSPH